MPVLLWVCLSWISHPLNALFEDIIDWFYCIFWVIAVTYIRQWFLSDKIPCEMVFNPVLFIAIEFEFPMPTEEFFSYYKMTFNTDTCTYFSSLDLIPFILCLYLFSSSSIFTAAAVCWSTQWNTLPLFYFTKFSIIPGFFELFSTQFNLIYFFSSIFAKISFNFFEFNTFYVTKTTKRSFLLERFSPNESQMWKCWALWTARWAF